MSREAFEHWFVRHYISRGYVSSKAELQEAWQAATSAQEARVRELEEALALAEDALCGITLNTRCLKEKVRKVLSVTNRSGCHDWQLDGPSGEFESFYECSNCGACVLEDADGPSKPTTGCATAREDV